MTDFIALLKNNEDWLITKILSYAEKHGFTKYTSTLPEAWRLSISGISGSLIKHFEISKGEVYAFHPEDNYESDPLTEFGVIEAQKHRKRGVALGMFLGLMKYYRASYTDLIEMVTLPSEEKNLFLNYINNSFDRIEITYCVEWNGNSRDALIRELQDSNRNITNEKNKFLTIFESLQLPVILFDDSLNISDLNHAAIETFTDLSVAGSAYYNKDIKSHKLHAIKDQLIKVIENIPVDSTFEIPLITNNGESLFKVKSKKMQDKSKKFEGVVVILEDISVSRKAETELLEKELQYRNLANSGTALIWAAGTDKLCNYFNEIWLNFTGKSLSENIGNGWIECVHPDDLCFCVSTYNSAFDKREMFEMEYRLRHFSGEYRWILDIGTPNYNLQGEFIGYIGHCFDITERKKTEIAYKDSTAKYQKLFEEDLTGNFITDEKGMVLDCNSSFLEIFGFDSRDEIVGKSILQFYEDLSEEEHLKNELQKNRLIRMYETRRKRKDGSLIHVVENIVADFDSSGKITEIKCHLFDITRRKLLESSLKESEAIARTLLNTSDKVIILIDARDFRIIDINEFGAFILEKKISELVGKTIFDFPPYSMESDKVKKIESALRTGAPVDFQDEWEGRNFFNQIYPLINEDGDVGKIAIFSDDITELKKTEESLKYLNSKLSESNRTKDTLFSVISHDLRSPIASIISFSELLSNNIRRYDYEKIGNYLKIINTTSENTMALLDNLLLWSRMQSGSFEFKPVTLKLKLLIHEIIDLLKPAASIKNININHSLTDDVIYADPNMLKTVIRNLLQNAIKFTNPGGEITIQNNLGNNCVEVIVSDNGIGMNRDKQSKLFHTVDSIYTKGTSDEKGFGVGLILCRDFVEMHGGNIFVRSTAGIGSEFKVTLPLSNPERIPVID